MSINLSNEKIKYVAIGDSISEGYNGHFNFGYAGTMKKNQEITGTSWPAYFARMIQKLNKNYLESYDNFAISGTRPEDWNYFLGINNEKYNYKNSKEKINFGLLLDSRKNNPERGRLFKLFKNFGKDNINDFDFFIKKIKAANLITINIGANYLIPKIPLDAISQWILNKNITNEKIKKRFSEIISSSKEDIDVMLKKIKQHNQHANVYLIGYPSFFTPLYKAINELFIKFGFDEEITTFLYSQINHELKNVAIKNKVNFIDVSNNVFWNENQSKLTNVFFEIHPTVFGYKKMAQDIFCKIVLSNSFFAQSIKKISNSIPTFNQKYLNNDHNSFKNGIDLLGQRITDEKILKFVFGNKLKNGNFFRKTKIELFSENLITPIDFEQSLNPNNDPNAQLNISIKKGVMSFFTSLNIKIYNEDIKKINELLKHKNFKNFVIKSKIISNALQRIQDKIDDHYLKYRTISNEKFVSICLEQILNVNFIFNIVSQLSKEFSTLSKSIIKNIKGIIINLITNNNFNDDVKELIVKFLLLAIEPLFLKWKIKIKNIDIYNTLKNFVDDSDIKLTLIKIIEFSFKNIHKLSKLKTSHDFLHFLIKNENLIEYDKLFFIFTKQESILNELCKKILKKSNIKNNLYNLKIIKNFWVSLFQYLNSNYLLDKMLKKFIYEFLLNQNATFSFQEFLNFLISLNKNEFIKYKNSKSISIKKERKLLNAIIDGFNLILDNIDYNSGLFKSILNLEPSWNLFINKSSKRMNLINIIKIIQKISYLEAPMNDFVKTIYDEYKKNKNIKNNKYYKMIFRIILLLLLISFKLFKTKDRNLYWQTVELPSISKYVMKLCGLRKSNENDFKEFILSLIGEENNEILLRKCNEKTYQQNQILWYIFSLEVNSIDKFSKKNKDEIIFQSIKKGYWILSKNKSESE